MDFFSSTERQERPAAMLAPWVERKRSFGSTSLCVGDCAILTQLTILAKFIFQMSKIEVRKALHNVAWAKGIGDDSLTWKCIQKYGSKLQESLYHNYRDLLERGV